MDRGDQQSGSGAQAAPAAAALAMGAAGDDAGTSARAREYLEEQTELTRLQIEDMKREDRLRLWSFRVRHVGDVLDLTFKFGVAFVVIAIVFAIGAAVWSAASDNALVIEAFSVPPDMAQKGLTGQVVATQLQDKLSGLQAETNSMRAASSYENNWGSDIKVQIPETGVSIGDIGRYLRDWLGNETHITGEVFHDGDQVTVTARVGAGAARKFTGRESDLDGLLQKAAESVYGTTQPYRYGVYLSTQNRLKEAAQVYNNLVATSAPVERAWAYIGLTTLDNSRGAPYAALSHSKQAAALRPDFILGWLNVLQAYQNIRDYGAQIDAARKLESVLAHGRETDINPAAQQNQALVNAATIAQLFGDFQKSIDVDRKIETLPDYAGSIEAAILNDAGSYTYLHDPAGVDRSIGRLSPPADKFAKINRDAQVFVDRVLLGQWEKGLALSQMLHDDAKVFGPAAHIFIRRGLVPLAAMAKAGTGRIAEAKADIADTPSDCDDCSRVHVVVAEMARDWKTAEHWAAHIVARSPSSPFGYSDLGRVLLEKGDPDGAIAKLQIAHDKGPHWADPLVYWGEALMQKNRSDLALAKFEEANKYAPNWGRLHLKWGEALYYAGDRADARQQFAIAAKLYLTAPERTALRTFEGMAGERAKP